MQGVQSPIMELRFPHAARQLSLCDTTKTQHSQNKNKKIYKKFKNSNNVSVGIGGDCKRIINKFTSEHLPMPLPLEEL